MCDLMGNTQSTNQARKVIDFEISNSVGHNYPENRGIENSSRLTSLDMSRQNSYNYCMPNIKISSKVEESAWQSLKFLAAEQNRNISSVLTEAVEEYIQRKRLRPVVLAHLEQSMEKNEELGKLLAK